MSDAQYIVGRMLYNILIDKYGKNYTITNAAQFINSAPIELKEQMQQINLNEIKEYSTIKDKAFNEKYEIVSQLSSLNIQERVRAWFDIVKIDELKFVNDKNITTQIYLKDDEVSFINNNDEILLTFNFKDFNDTLLVLPLKSVIDKDLDAHYNDNLIRFFRHKFVARIKTALLFNEITNVNVFDLFKED